MILLLSTLNRLINFYLAISLIDEAINSYPFSILSTLIIQILPVEGGSEADGLILNFTFKLFVLTILPWLVALRRLGEVIGVFPTEEDAAKEIALILETLISQATLPVPLTLSRGATIFSRLSVPPENNAACCPTNDIFNFPCLYLAIESEINQCHAKYC